MRLFLYMTFALVLAGITTRNIENEVVTGISIALILLTCTLNEVIEINKKLKK